MTAVEPRTRGQRGGASLQPQMSSDEARAMTEEVLRDFGVLWNKVLDLYERGAHIALNYTSWGEYWRSEFGVSGARGEQLVRAGRVARALEAAGIPLPANDSTARTLLPVLKNAPEDLTKVWQAALDAHDTPMMRHLKPLVEPYRQMRTSGDEDATVAKRSATKRARGTITRALDDARGAAEAALAGLDDALATNPSDAMLDEWRENAKLCAQRYMELATKLRANGS